MESIFIFFIKSCVLIALFYLVYNFMLHKETFFNTNRWFLLVGLFVAIVFPLMVYTKIVVVKTFPAKFDWSKIPITNSVGEQPFEINWYFIFAIVYCVGVAIYSVKLIVDFYSLRLIFKGKKVKHQDNFRLIDTHENVAPFSYGSTIVYNSSLYSEAELDNILKHEKVHCKQNHTIDVLISRVFCILFWFNPIIWMYNKAILQNLEFIADNEVSKKISDKKAYQFTLLKITTHENCVAITNHFYQSLIKKRIVMLNKKQSEKRNSWKYAVVFPALIAFVLLFQVKTIAQAKIVELEKNESVQTVTNPVDFYRIDKNTTDQQLIEKVNAINNNYGIKMTFSRLKRNTKNELIAIKIVLKKGKEISKIKEMTGTEAIEPFAIVVSKNNIGLLEINFVTEDKINKGIQAEIVAPDAPLSTNKEYFIDGVKASESELNKLNPNDIESLNVINNSETKEFRIITKKQSKTGSLVEYEKDGAAETITLVDGKKVAADTDLTKTDSKTIVTYKITKIKEKTEKQVLKNENNTVQVAKKPKNGYEISYETSDAADNISRIINNKNVDYKKAIIIINGKTSDYEDLNKTTPSDIVSIGIQQPANQPESVKADIIKKYGEKALNGIITITTR